MSNRNRVVITGMGAVTPLGNDMPTTWKGVTESRSGVRQITHFDASGFPSQIAGEVKNFDFSKWIQAEPVLSDAMNNTRFALAACDEAVRDSGLKSSEIESDRTGIYYAAGDGEVAIPALARAFHKGHHSGGGNTFSVPDFLKERVLSGDGVKEAEKDPSATLRHLVRHFKIGGPAYNCLTACAASAQAIGEGTELIRSGEVDVVISGGSHSMIHPFGIAGFCLLTALSTMNTEPEKASRPFDATRGGFVIAEGAGAVILENYEHAKKRGAHIYGELVGFGTTADAYRLTDSHPEGIGAAAALSMALNDAGVNPGEVDYLNAHGTSTKVNDAVETLAIRKAFGPDADKLWVSSTKSMTGHLIAAAGAVELQLCLLAMRDGIAPPTINYKHKDPQCDL
ncbi:MAG: beta-ketoacyl-[acyl-carrier-protein] synthase family protein, partial [Candidatus Omnitrophica bacterium]|nr:beta-ketoacyl-[acyl-carrier-protein] synthase family protein [Candidatus Omnitrophota bacterium]